MYLYVLNIFITSLSAVVLCVVNTSLQLNCCCTYLRLMNIYFDKYSQPLEIFPLFSSVVCVVGGRVIKYIYFLVSVFHIFPVYAYLRVYCSKHYYFSNNFFFSFFQFLFSFALNQFYRLNTYPYPFIKCCILVAPVIFAWYCKYLCGKLFS